MLREFKEFITRGNVMDLAVAVIIGAAFTAVVNSLVGDIVMPIIGIILGGIDFTDLTIQVGLATIAYGNFIQAIINFLLIGFTVFLVIKAVKSIENQMKRKTVEEPDAEPEPPDEDIYLLREIRDILKSQR